MTLKRVWIPSPNYSSRGGSGVRLVVVHTAEGARTYQELGNFFANPASQVSSHVGIDDTPGKIGEYVKRPDKAWTAANANPFSIQVELCAFAAWTPAQWDQHPQMLQNCGEWIREECNHYGIPIRKLSAAQTESGMAGVCGHRDLGWAGNDHSDPGPNFPWDRVIQIAKGGSGGGGKPAPVLGALPFIADWEEDDMALPDYVINDVANGSRKFAVYPSGLVRRMAGPEWQYVRDKFNVPIFEMKNAEEGERYFQFDQALRGQVKERD